MGSLDLHFIKRRCNMKTQYGFIWPHLYRIIPYLQRLRAELFIMKMIYISLVRQMEPKGTESKAARQWVKIHFLFCQFSPIGSLSLISSPRPPKSWSLKQEVKMVQRNLHLQEQLSEMGRVKHPMLFFIKEVFGIFLNGSDRGSSIRCQIHFSHPWKFRTMHFET